MRRKLEVSLEAKPEYADQEMNKNNKIGDQLGHAAERICNAIQKEIKDGVSVRVSVTKGHIKVDCYKFGQVRGKPDRLHAGNYVDPLTNND